MTQSSCRCRNDGGSVVVEFAMVVPILVAMISGIFEFGMLYRQQIEFAGVVQTAARVGSHGGNSRFSDRLTLLSLAAGVPGLSNTVVTKVVIFHSSSTNGQLPANCSAILPSTGDTIAAGSNTAGSECNVYRWSQVTNAASLNFGSIADASCGISALDRNYCPISRNTSVLDVGGPDQFGVWVQAQYTGITRLFGASPRTLNEHAVFRVEALGN